MSTEQRNASDEPKRVLLVTARYFPYMGGVETHVYEVGRRLAQAGASVTVLTTDPSGALPPRETVEGIEVLRVRAYPARRDYYLAPDIYRVITRMPWDIVHVQGCHTFVAPLAMLAAKRAGIPYVLTFHTGGHSSRLRTLLRGMQWKALRPLLAGAQTLIGVSAFEAACFQRQLRLPVDRFRVIQNGGRLPSVPEGARIEPDASAKLILSVGRLERYKGHQRVITALPIVRERFPGARLRIVGAGPYERELRRLVFAWGLADCVEIGAIPASDRGGMATALARADVVTLLSEYEAHPIAAMEALALRRPLVVASTSGLRELAERGLARAIPIASTPEQVAAAIVEQIERPLLPAPVELPTWEGCVESLLDVYGMSARRAICAS